MDNNNNNNERNIIFIASEKDHGGTFFQNIFRITEKYVLGTCVFRTNDDRRRVLVKIILRGGEVKTFRGTGLFFTVYRSEIFRNRVPDRASVARPSERRSARFVSLSQWPLD